MTATKNYAVSHTFRSNKYYDTPSLSVVPIDTLIGDAKVEVKKDGEGNTEKNQCSASKSRLSESRSTHSASIGRKTRLAPKITAHDQPSSKSTIAPHTGSTKTPLIIPTYPIGGADPNGISSTTSLDNVVDQPVKHPARSSRASDDGSRSIFQQAVSGITTLPVKALPLLISLSSPGRLRRSFLNITAVLAARLRFVYLGHPPQISLLLKKSPRWYGETQ